MNKDMIYRQDVIDVLEHERDEALVRLYDYQLAIDAVMGLPSARQWIPCNERMPAEETRVLVAEEDGCIYIAECMRCLLPDEPQYEWWSYDFKVHPIAWMPLPTPYKGGQE